MDKYTGMRDIGEKMIIGRFLNWEPGGIKLLHAERRSWEEELKLGSF